jgi:hypothetical protein
MRHYDYLFPHKLAVSGRSVEKGEEKPEIYRGECCLLHKGTAQVKPFSKAGEGR